MKHPVFKCVTAIALLAFVIVSGGACTNPWAVPPANASGTLSISLSIAPYQDKTLDTGIDLVVTGYQVSLVHQTSGEVYPTFTLTASQTTSDALTLAVGVWNVTVDSFNASSRIVHSGSSTIEILEGTQASCVVTLSRASGNGTFDFSLEWPKVVSNARAEVTFALRGGSPSVQTVLPTGTPVYRIDWNQTGLAAGYYVLGLKLYSDTTIVWEGTELLRIAASQTTVADLVLSAGLELAHLIKPDMIEIPAGSFSFVSGGPVVGVSKFWMGRTEVTQAQWLGVMSGVTAYPNPSAYQNYNDAPSRPVEQVSWYAALVYCNKLSLLENRVPVYSIRGSTDPDDWDGTHDNSVVIPGGSDSNWDAALMDRTASGYRLPTEAEWQYAARGGVDTAYAGSTTINPVAWYGGNSYDSTYGYYWPHPVGTKAANAYGLYDMTGNVNEWCWDWYGEYSAVDQNDPVGSLTGSSRVSRGGHSSASESNCTVSTRYAQYPADSVQHYGLRVVYGSPMTLSLDQSSIVMVVGDSPVTLVATVLPSDSTYTLEWSSSNTAVATVVDGVVSPAGSGTATITARITGTTVSRTCVVTVDSDRTSGNLGTLKIVQGGSLNNGSSTVTVDTFWMSQKEITQAQFQAVMGTNPSTHTAASDYPVETVNWYDALVFCNKLSILEGKTPVYTINGYTDTDMWDGTDDGVVSVPASSASLWNLASADMAANGYRLPTEAEWEYAARGGNKTAGRTYAGSDVADDVAWHNGNSTATIHTAGSKVANELGLYDMSGNASEWCWDWYGDYPATAQTNPLGAASGTYRVIRGGSWAQTAEYSTVANRLSYADPGSRTDYQGFRVVRHSGVDTVLSTSFDFETTNYGSWTGNWARSAASFHGGAYSLQSDVIASGLTSSQSITVEYSDAGTVDFWLFVGGDYYYYNYLYFYIDGVQQSSTWTASNTWANSGSFAVSAGTHTFTWSYIHSSYTSSSSTDCVRIDDVKFSGMGTNEGFIRIVPVVDTAFTVSILSGTTALTGDGTLTYGTNLNLSAGSTAVVDSWQWYLGGTLVDSDATLDSFGADLAKGWYTITLIGRSGSASASTQYRFKVE